MHLGNGPGGGPGGRSRRQVASGRAVPLLAILAATSACAAPPGGQPAPVRTGPVSAAQVWLQSVEMVSPTAGWALRWTQNPAVPDRAIEVPARTTDGGRTWTDVTPSHAGPLLDPVRSQEVLLARTTSRAWLAVTRAGSPGSAARPPTLTEVFGTADAGRTWTESAPIRGRGTAAWLDFVDPANGWLVQDSGAAMRRDPIEVYRSVDGGRHWSRAAATGAAPGAGTGGNGLPVRCGKTGISFATATAGWLTTSCDLTSETVLTTRDGGVHWAPQALPLPAGTCAQAGCFALPPQFAGRRGFLTVARATAPAYLLVSGDTGLTWRMAAPLPGAAGVYPRIRFFDATHGLLIPAGPQGATSGSFWYTTSDAGLTWAPVRQGMRFDRPGITFDFVSPATGFAWIPATEGTGPAASPVYETTDGGQSWAAFAPRLAR